MAITTKQWSQIKTALNGVFGRVVFGYRGYKISVNVEQDGRKLVLGVYINGEIRESWQQPDHELNLIIQQIWYRKKMQAYTAKMRKELKGFISKKELNKKVEIITPWFPSSISLVKQYKSLEGLELMEVV
ncbi:hypothetical protein ACWIVU_00395 [Ursidibacter arcticus]